jgi:hypothetical protein
VGILARNSRCALKTLTRPASPLAVGPTSPGGRGTLGLCAPEGPGERVYLVDVFHQLC